MKTAPEDALIKKEVFSDKNSINTKLDKIMVSVAHFHEGHKHNLCKESQLPWA